MEESGASSSAPADVAAPENGEPLHDEASSQWSFACPACGKAIPSTVATINGECAAHCQPCDRFYSCTSGIWRFLPAERLNRYEAFIREYDIVRKAQGWGRPDAAYFLALPRVAADDPQRDVWRRRNESHRVLCARIIEPLVAKLGRPLRILDLGAGNCWLSYRLTQLGHRVAAIDLSDDAIDGLGAHVWYRPAESVPAKTPGIHSPFTPIQGEFDRLPMPDEAADVAVFNASLHYSPDYGVTLREALRVLSPEGALVIVDSPVYRRTRSGELMVREREKGFERSYGFRSDNLQAENFLTWKRVEELARDFSLRWQVYDPVGRLGGWGRGVDTLKQQWRRLHGLRELAELPVIVGYRT